MKKQEKIKFPKKNEKKKIKLTRKNKITCRHLIQVKIILRDFPRRRLVNLGLQIDSWHLNCLKKNNVGNERCF